MVGRSDEVISFGGIKIDAQLIDLIIKGTPGVVDAICVKSPKPDRNEVCAFVVFDETVDRNNCVVQIRERYQEHTGLPCFLGPIHEIDKVPYSENGRPMRSLLEQVIIGESAPAKEQG